MAKAKTVNVDGVNIKQSVINSFDRVGFDYKFWIALGNSEGGRVMLAMNRFSGQSAETTPLVAKAIHWVYETSNAFERGNYSVKIADFDRIRYFVLEQDSNAYMTCLD